MALPPVASVGFYLLQPTNVADLTLAADYKVLGSTPSLHSFIFSSPGLLYGFFCPFWLSGNLNPSTNKGYEHDKLDCERGRAYSSVVEHSTADREVLGSTPSVPSFFFSFPDFSPFFLLVFGYLSFHPFGQSSLLNCFSLSQIQQSRTPASQEPNLFIILCWYSDYCFNFTLVIVISCPLFVCACVGSFLFCSPLREDIDMLWLMDADSFPFCPTLAEMQVSERQSRGWLMCCVLCCLCAAIEPSPRLYCVSFQRLGDMH